MKDDTELNAHLLKLGLEGIHPHPGEGAEAIHTDALEGLARTYLLAEAVIRRLADWIDRRRSAARPARHDLPLNLDDEAAARDSAARLQAAVGSEVSSMPSTTTRPKPGQLRHRAHAPRQPQAAQIDERIPASGDYRSIRHGHRIHLRPDRPGAIMRRGEKQQAVASFADAIRWLLAKSNAASASSATKAWAK
jgi:DNA gyrase subunit B